MPLKIIYVDDELDLLDIFVDEFSRPGFEILTFSDPKMAIDEIKSNPPDLLFLDYQLPGTTGEKIALEIDPLIPKVLITGNLSIKTQVNFLRVLQKPISFSEIESILASFQVARAS